MKMQRLWERHAVPPPRVPAEPEDSMAQMSASPEIRVLGKAEEIFHAAAQQFVQQAQDAVHNRGRFTVAFSGGSTPKGLYSLLASEFRSSMPWKQIFFFWGDE